MFKGCSWLLWRHVSNYLDNLKFHVEYLPYKITENSYKQVNLCWFRVWIVSWYWFRLIQTKKSCKIHKLRKNQIYRCAAFTAGYWGRFIGKSNCIQSRVKHTSEVVGSHETLFISVFPQAVYACCSHILSAIHNELLSHSSSTAFCHLIAAHDSRFRKLAKIFNNIPLKKWCCIVPDTLNFLSLFP